MKQRIALIGNPNCGKTTVFNHLTGSRQKVGNWPGVTVDKKMGQLFCGCKEYDIIDLPGVYSLNVSTGEGALDERIASNYLMSHEADLLINVIDSSNLARNLYLTLQLLDMNVPMIVVLNMTDVAKRQNKTVSAKKLSQLLHCPVVEMIGRKGQGIKNLKSTICDYQKPKHQFELPLNHYLQEAVDRLQFLLPGNQRWQALRLLEQDKVVYNFLDAQTQKAVDETIHDLQSTLQEDADILLADVRYQSIYEITDKVLVQNTLRRSVTEVIDRLVMHRFLGVPIFLFIMYLMFEFSMNIGTLLQPLFDIGSTVIFVDGLNHLSHVLHLPVWLNAVLSQGVGLGINTVTTFIPQIGLLFLFLSFLEDSGYMSRAAFVMDKFMQSVGLPGKAFIPLIVGFGCNVPAIMATRTLDNQRDRILTTMMSPFMSCGARLAIFVVFASAFFPHHGGAVVFCLYLIGIIVAMLTGFLMKLTLLKKEDAPFVMELPIYHLPHVRSILLNTWQRLKRFIFRAGKVIVPVCILVGTLNAMTLNGGFNPAGSKQSVLADAGRSITPILAPMGVDQNNWPATVGLISGTLAKEVVIGSLNALYTQSQFKSTPSQYDLLGGLKQAVLATWQGFTNIFSAQMLNPFTANKAGQDMTKSAMGEMAKAFGTDVAAFAYLLFVLLYVPCISTMGVIAREIGKSWAYFSTFWSISIAYTVAVVFYQTATFSLHKVSSALWIIGILLFQMVLVRLLYHFAERESC